MNPSPLIKDFCSYLFSSKCLNLEPEAKQFLPTVIDRPISQLNIGELSYALLYLKGLKYDDSLKQLDSTIIKLWSKFISKPITQCSKEHLVDLEKIRATFEQQGLKREATILRKKLNKLKDRDETSTDIKCVSHARKGSSGTIKETKGSTISSLMSPCFLQYTGSNPKQRPLDTILKQWHSQTPIECLFTQDTRVLKQWHSQIPMKGIFTQDTELDNCILSMQSMPINKLSIVHLSYAILRFIVLNLCNSLVLHSLEIIDELFDELIKKEVEYSDENVTILMQLITALPQIDQKQKADALNEKWINLLNSPPQTSLQASTVTSSTSSATYNPGTSFTAFMPFFPKIPYVTKEKEAETRTDQKKSKNITKNKNTRTNDLVPSVKEENSLISRLRDIKNVKNQNLEEFINQIRCSNILISYSEENLDLCAINWVFCHASNMINVHLKTIPKILDTTLEFIADLRYLTSCTLEDCFLKDEAVFTLARSTSITDLNLAHNFISDEGADYLADSPMICKLNLSYNNIHDKGAISISRMPSLTEVDLSHNRVGDDGAQSLSLLDSLKTIHLKNNALTEAGIRCLLASGKNLLMNDEIEK